MAFFALLGGIFALTQYLQFAHGYEAIAEAFTEAMGAGLLVAAALTAATAVVVARLLPARESAALAVGAVTRRGACDPAGVDRHDADLTGV